MSRQAAAAALARRLSARLLARAAAAAGGGVTTPAARCCSAASPPSALAAAALPPSSSPLSSSWTPVSGGARALSSYSAASSASLAPSPASSSSSIPSLTSSSTTSTSNAARLSTSAAPRKSDDDEGAIEYDDSDDFARGGRYSSIVYPDPQAAVGRRAPSFTAPAVVGGEIRPVSLSDYRGRYVLLLWYPKDFTYVCPTELIAFSDRAKEFEALDCQVIAASTDSEECHLAWIKTPRHRGGLGYMQIPIVADVTKEIAAQYGVLLESAGIALRGLFLINPQGVVQHITINDLPIGRSVDEALRTLQAVRFHAEHGEVCPAGWKPGDRGMTADAEKAQEYFGVVYKEGGGGGGAAGKDGAAGGDDMAPTIRSIGSRREWEAQLKSGRPFVLDLFAPWCGKCRMISPLVEELAAKHNSTVDFVKLDTTAEPVEAIAQELGVKALPAFHFYGADGKPALPAVTGYKRRPLEEAVAELLQLQTGGK